MKCFNAVILALGFSVAATPASADVTLQPRERDNLGIETVALARVEVWPTRQATALVLDPTPLITLLGELRAARAAAAAARGELARSEHLYQGEGNVSLKALEAARTQALSDGARLDALRAQLLASWGAAIAAMSPAEHAGLAEQLVSGHAALVRAELLQADLASPEVGEARLRVLEGEQSWDAKVIGEAAHAPNQGVGAAFLLRVAAGLQPGRVLIAELREHRHALQGVAVPRSALVRFGGDDWVFIEDKTNHFVRLAVHPRERIDGGWLVVDELHAGSRAVTVGAGLLLGAEGGAAASD